MIWAKPDLGLRCRLDDVVALLGYRFWALHMRERMPSAQAAHDRHDEPIFSEIHRRFGEFVRLNPCSAQVNIVPALSNLKSPSLLLSAFLLTVSYLSVVESIEVWTNTRKSFPNIYLL